MKRLYQVELIYQIAGVEEKDSSFGSAVEVFVVASSVEDAIAEAKKTVVNVREDCVKAQYVRCDSCRNIQRVDN